MSDEDNQQKPFKFKNYEDDDPEIWKNVPHFAAPSNFGDGRRDG